MLGKLQPAYFPRVFGAGQDEPLDAAIVQAKFAALAGEIKAATGDARSPVEVADGFLKIAVENMANAIKKISVQRGYDVTDYTLCCFGGAGGQHACLVADALGMKKVYLHPFAGVLSAYGMGLADVRALREKSVEERLVEGLVPKLEGVLGELAGDADGELANQQIPEASRQMLRRLHLKYEGTDTSIEVDYGSPEQMKADFEDAHRQRYGFIMADKALVVETAAVEAVGATGNVGEGTSGVAPAGGGEARALATIRSYMAGAERDAPIYDRGDMTASQKIDGPAIVREATGTIVVEPGWQAEMNAGGDLVLTRVVPMPKREAIGTSVDPVMLEVFNNLFMSIAEQMGFTLQNTAYSVNIKERVDFSCAIFDSDGSLIANAPHMPVHLGSMGESIRAVINNNAGKIRPGDVYMLNAPYNGGTHLPDITIVTPVFDAAGTEILFYVGARGHHADIGGLTPGSMPPNSTVVEEEGVLIDNFLLVDQGEFREPALYELLSSGDYPTRNPDQNIADIKAQIAANEKGVTELRRMVGHFGLDVVRAYMGHVQDNAEESVRRVIDVLQDGTFTYPLDNGASVHVSITIDKTSRSAKVDFTGSSDQLENNFNAPSAICRAAVLYVFRTLVDGDIPMNEGCLKPIELIIPEGSMLAPRYPAAVVAGNVETSQVVTDTLYGALGVMAAAQGTMNNTTFGNDRYQYYETVAGGSGAGPDFDGTDAVHTHMTNSRLTDPEVLEMRFPVRLESYEIRRGSGGRGRHHGGDGAIRKLRFLEEMTISILSNHRDVPPYGMAGGEPGALGQNWIERTDGTIHRMSGTDTSAIHPNDIWVLETPGGGGYGDPVEQASPEATE
jgi:5-oxoprolinase (ATP-hydrolysing)